MTLGNNSAAQKHAEDMLTNDYFSHWGIDGLKPYMRYTLAGGFNYEAENVFYYSGGGSSLQRDLKEILDDAEESLMGSEGHRINILNKWHRKVNVGLAYGKESLFLVQQFEGDYITFDESPSIQDGTLSLSGKTLAGFVVEGIQVRYDQPPHALTSGQLRMTYAYFLGQPAAFIRPPPPPGSHYLESETVYSWKTLVDPYEVSPDTPPSFPPSSLRRTPPPPLVVQKTVKWIDARSWNVSGSSFMIDVDLSVILSDFGKGVYTVVIWGESVDEFESLTNYSIFVE